ncbi:MAG TPA: glycoside hydrolase family 32 protein [Propionibacterium sp.]|nr:glycoside hydrolase family 32 protein [Propionibacterium sp.]
MIDTPQYRPTLHFTPESTWMNDPNGLLFHNGRYHLFFQNNPTGRVWGNIGWGHAVSTDLLRWEHKGLAIPATEYEMAYSGSAVWDRTNTSGLGSDDEGPLVAFFTSAYTEHHPTKPGQQAQSIAYSLDDGETWARYEGNPVLERSSDCFRDPKVSWHEPTGRWVMVAVEADHRQLVIYSSANLLDWQHESTFGPVGEEGIQWECPDLLEVPVEGGGSRWVLLLSTNPGGFAGGSGMRYFVGDFDGCTFTPDGDPRWLDHGPDFYAAVSFHGTPEPTVVGWMSNWVYANETPTFPWQSAMTLARRLSLTPDSLALRHRPVLPEELPDGVHRADFTLEVGDEVVVESGEGEVSRCVIRREEAGLVVDRSAADPHGVHGKLPATPPVPLPEGPVSGFLIEDHGLIELFLDGGLIAVTIQTFPHPGPVRILT